MDFSANNTKPPETRETPKAALRFQRRASANCNFLDLHAESIVCSFHRRVACISLAILDSPSLSLHLGGIICNANHRRESSDRYLDDEAADGACTREEAPPKTPHSVPNAILSLPLCSLFIVVFECSTQTFGSINRP
jgi:hypothetical protein